MANATQTDLLREDISFAEHVRIANALEAGKTVDAPDPVVDEPVSGEPISTPEPDRSASSVDGEADGGDGKATPPRVDKRTREGRKASIQQEIDDLTEKRHQTRREYDDAQARLSALRAELAAAETARAKPAPTAETKPVTQAEWQRFRAMPDAPQVRDFKEYEDYTAALSLFIADKRYDERRAADEARSADTQRRDSWNTKLTKVRAEIPDFDTRVLKAGQLELPRHVIDYLLKRDEGPKILLHLAEHPADYQRITTLPPDDAIEEMVTLRQSLTPAQADASVRSPSPAPSISRAKPPVKLPVAAPKVDDDVDEENLPLGEFVRRGNAAEARSARH